MITVIAIVTDGLVYAAWLFVVAIGLTLIFGVMKILNVAHGAFYAFGAYAAATAIGLYFDRGWPVAGGYLVVAIGGDRDRPGDGLHPGAGVSPPCLRQG